MVYRYLFFLLQTLWYSFMWGKQGMQYILYISYIHKGNKIWNNSIIKVFSKSTTSFIHILSQLSSCISQDNQFPFLKRYFSHAGFFREPLHILLNFWGQTKLILAGRWFHTKSFLMLVTPLLVDLPGLWLPLTGFLKLWDGEYFDNHFDYPEKNAHSIKCCLWFQVTKWSSKIHPVPQVENLSLGTLLLIFRTQRGKIAWWSDVKS